MDRVEFYLDGRRLGESTVSPYSLRWTITMANAANVLPTASSPISGTIVVNGVLVETHTITVKAYDKAGNMAESQPVQIKVQHKPKENK